MLSYRLTNTGALLVLVTAITSAQAPRPPLPPLDTEIAERGKIAFDHDCASCHGADTRGTARGVDLVRAFSVRLDPRGEQLGPFLSAGHKDNSVPPIHLTTLQVSDVAMFLRVRLAFANSGDKNVAPDILVGNAKDGEAFFNGAGKCQTCHSVTGDLKGIGSKYTATQLQNRVVLPRGRGPLGRGDPREPARTVTITQPNGQATNGTLVTISDFLVTYRDDSGALRTVTRRGDIPKVTIHDPLAAHIDNMRRMTTKQMHDLTAYLVTK